MARTFALIAAVWRILQQVSCSSEMVPNAPKQIETHQNMSLARFRLVAKRSQMHPNEKKRTKTWVYGPVVWIVSIRYEKFRHNFMARTFILIAPVWRILQQVSCSSEMVPNAPKRKGRHENMRLGSNWKDREHSLWKILTKHRGTNCCINCTRLSCFASSFV